MKKNEFRVRKTFERPIKNIETFKTSIEEDYEKYVNNYWEAAARNDNKENKKTPMRAIASILSIISIICLFLIDNDTILGFIYLAPATFYALSYFTGERFPKDLYGMTNTLFLSIIWVFIALFWFL